MLTHLLSRLNTTTEHIVTVLGERLRAWTQPLEETLVGGAVRDMTHNKHDLVAENPLLRRQVIVLKRQVNQPMLQNRDQLMLVFLASKVLARREALLFVKPATLLG